jgi:3-hydroxyisobutyrate dehydrogenase-like beta-hydroxyacid dehydrogenase
LTRPICEQYDYTEKSQEERKMKTIAPGVTKVGFIGLGLMGSRIAEHLLTAGFQVMAYDRDRTRVEKLIEHGASPAADISEIGSTADVILSSLPDDEVVSHTYAGADGLLSHVREGCIIVEMSTVSPETPRELNRIAGQHKAYFLDVTISGSTPAVEQGTVTLFAGGEEEAFHACEPLFQTFARQYFYLGPTGSGATMKLAVNLLLGVGMQAIAEAVAFGRKAGLERDRLLDVLSQTAVIPPALVGKFKRAMLNDYSPQFPLRLMNKDFRLILETAATAWVPLPATAAAFQINTAECTNEIDEDFSAVIRQMEKLARSDAPIEGWRSAAASGS